MQHSRDNSGWVDEKKPPSNRWLLWLAVVMLLIYAGIAAYYVDDFMTQAKREIKDDKRTH
jgi:hypothetical protein